MVGILFCFILLSICIVVLAGFIRTLHKASQSDSSPWREHHKRLQNILANCLLVITSLLFIVFLLEVFLQIRFRGNRFRGNPWYAGGNHPRFLVMPDSLRSYKLRPEFEGMEVSIWGDFKVPVSINSLGMRDREHDLHQDQISILAVGNSYAFGEGVLVQDCYLWKLEQFLNTLGLDLPVEIYKAAVPAYNLKQEYFTIVDFCHIKKPDWVIMAISTKRLERNFDDYAYHHGYIIKNYFIPKLHEIKGNLYESPFQWKPRQKAHLFLQAHVYSYNFLKYRFPNIGRELKRRYGTKYPKLFGIKEKKITDKHKKRWAAEYTSTIDILLKTRELAKQKGFKIFIFLFDGENWKDNDLEAYCLENNFPYVNVSGAIDSAKAQGEVVKYPKDGHWNSRGHEIATEVLFKELQKYIIKADANDKTK